MQTHVHALKNYTVELSVSAGRQYIRWPFTQDVWSYLRPQPQQVWRDSAVLWLGVVGPGPAGPFKKWYPGLNKMVQQEKALASTLDSLTLSWRATWWKEKTVFYKLSSDLHMHIDMYIDKHRHNCIIETKDTELNVVLHACNHSKLGSRDRRIQLKVWGLERRMA